MRSLDALHRQVNELVEQAQRRYPSKKRIELDLSVFTEDEQQRVRALMELIDYDLEQAFRPLAALSDAQLDELEGFFLLHTALVEGDRARAASLRRRLDMPASALVAAFLAIDETRIPADFADARKVRDRHGFEQHLYRAAFVSMRQNVQRSQDQGGSVRHSDLGTMRRWVEAFG